MILSSHHVLWWHHAVQLLYHLIHVRKSLYQHVMVSKIVLIDIQVSMDLIVYNKHAFMYYLYHFLKGNRNLKKRKDVLLNNMCSVCGKDRL